MNRKWLTYISAAIVPVVLFSCLDINGNEEATWASEQADLKNYINNITANGADVDTTDLGVYYITMEEGTGPFPKTGDTLVVGYAGYFISGALFDASYFNNRTDSTYTFVLGNPPKFKGWDDGMKVINKNAKVQLVVPSDLAFGSSGSGAIPPYKTLILVVKMKDIKPSI